MAKWGTVQSWVEVRQVNPATGQVEKFYRYVVVTAKGGVFTMTVPEADATRERLEPMLEKKATELDATLSL